MSAATFSAAAACVSAAFAGATSIAAWITVRGRRPKLEVRCSVGRAGPGHLVPDPEGDELAIVVKNLRDSDVQVTNVWFEGARSVGRRLQRRMAEQAILPPGNWFTAGAGQIPGTVRAHHTEVYVLRGDLARVAFIAGGQPRYRPAIEFQAARVIRGNWITVEMPASDQVVTSTSSERP